MLRVAIGGLIGTVLGFAGWRMLRRPPVRHEKDRHESSHESSDIDPGMVITPPEVDPKMVVTPRPRREGDVPPEVRM